MTLLLKLNNKQDFQTAVEWFDSKNNEAAFCNDSENEEFLSLSFAVTDQNDADALELDLDSEIIENTDITGFYFEIED
jgi:hypothetical protein